MREKTAMHKRRTNMDNKNHIEEEVSLINSGQNVIRDGIKKAITKKTG